MGGEDDRQQIQHSYLFDATPAHNCYGLIRHPLMFANLGLVYLIWLVGPSGVAFCLYLQLNNESLVAVIQMGTAP